MEMRKARENKTQTDVLATIADFEYHQNESPKQVDMVDKLPLSKGAVSNNCKKLVESGLVIKEDRHYKINRDELIKAYREHIEDYLTREKKNEIFDKIIEESNKIRTDTKRQLKFLLSEDEPRELIFNILISALAGSLEHNRVQTFREILLWTDQIISQTAQNVITSEDFEVNSENWKSLKLLFMLAVSFNHSHEEMSDAIRDQPLLEKYIPGYVPEQKIIEEYFGGNKDE